MTDEVTDLGWLDAPRIPSHLYVHVPFCASKCGYCDFASVSGADDELVSAVFAGIRTQLAMWGRTGLDGVLDTVYIGGGTPSLVAERVVDLLGYIRRVFVVHPAAEITVEANPDSLGREEALRFAHAGVTRISVGVQSFDDTVLRTLGRRHDSKSAWHAARAVVGAGLDLSVDLMCGVPEQSITSWSETLERAVSTGACHASVYPLSVEEGTPMQVAISAGLLPEPNGDVAAEMMLLAAESLGYHGLARYEVANYSVDRAHESRHNTAYWTGRPYIGVGPGAHGMLDAGTARAVGMIDEAEPGGAPARSRDTSGGVRATGAHGEVARVRYGNAPDIADWMVLRGDEVEMLDAAEAAREDVMLGMRLVRGVIAAQVEAAGLTGVLESLEADGLTELVGPEPRAWRTTQRGWLLGNEVFGRIWAGDE